MSYPPSAVRWLFTWLFPCLLAFGGCGDDSDDPEPQQEPARDATTAGATDAAADAGYSCTPPDDCRDFKVADNAYTACCSPVTECGYEALELDEETLMLYPHYPAVVAMATAGDPNGRCIPLHHFFGPRPGLYEHKVEVEDGEDILITPECESYTVLAFILPGCCLPDNTCALSTDESWPIFEGALMGKDAPFNRPECVPAEVLNQQFRDSEILEPFARTTASGTCDYAALAERLAE
jgi:hypothetical protein